jgi:2,5-dihydroxypyridine 5,6-dioxygenase
MNPYAVSYLGWGMNPQASYHDVINFEQRMDHLVTLVRGLRGSYLFSTGSAHNRKTRGHIDMRMMVCTVALDGRVLIKDGKIIDPEMIV